MQYLNSWEYMLFREEVGKYRMLSSSTISLAYPHTTVAIFGCCFVRALLVESIERYLSRLEIHYDCSIASSQHQAIFWLLCDLDIMNHFSTLRASR